MPNEFYDFGYQAGQACAYACTKQILGTKDGLELARMAGIKLDAIKRRDQEWYIKNSPEWSIGFWEGFLARGEEIKNEV